MHQEDKVDFFSLYRNYLETALDLRYSDVTNAVLNEAETKNKTVWLIRLNPIYGCTKP